MKLTVWQVPAQRERGARWDAEIVRAHGLRERMTAVPEDFINRLLQDVAELAKKLRTSKSR